MWLEKICADENSSMPTISPAQRRSSHLHLHARSTTAGEGTAESGRIILETMETHVINEEDEGGDGDNVHFCECPNKCQQFEDLPSDKGLMITLHIPEESSESSSVPIIVGEESAPDYLDANRNSKNGGSSSTSCTCLKLHPQLDANLPQFHPNIYIPSSLLDYPDHLIKYGGGGERNIFKRSFLGYTKVWFLFSDYTRSRVDMGMGRYFIWAV